MNNFATLHWHFTGYCQADQVHRFTCACQSRKCLGKCVIKIMENAAVVLPKTSVGWFFCTTLNTSWGTSRRCRPCQTFPASWESYKSLIMSAFGRGLSCSWLTFARTQMKQFSWHAKRATVARVECNCNGNCCSYFVFGCCCSDCCCS